MNSGSQNLSLGEAASHFLASLSPEEGKGSQQEVYKFVRWYGWERPLAELTAPEVANYAEQLTLSDIDYLKKLELIRTFLLYAKKEGWSRSNLATYLKTKKGKIGRQSLVRQGVAETPSLTQQGYAELKAKLAALKGKRSQAIDEIRKAAADKDFRENAPLEAAREQRGQLEGRIRELEEVVKSAIVVDDEQKSTHKASIGDEVVLRNLVSGEELHYIIVSTREVDPTRGKISSASPVGKAIIGRGEGEVVEVVVPVGKLRYQIEQVRH